MWLPESPRWLMKTGKKSQAKRILEKIGDADFVNESISSITTSLKGIVKTRYADIFKKAILPAVLTGIGLAVFQQLCGINRI